jgi:PAS domain S-box-containing protein
VSEDDRDRRIGALEAELAALRQQRQSDRVATSRRLRAIADALPVMISYIDADQRFRFANKAYEGWFERPLDQIVDRRLDDLMTPAIYAARRPYIERALAGERVTYQAVFHHGNGRRHTIVHHVPDIGKHGVTGFYALVQDVTDQRQALEAATESEQRFRRIADSAPVPMWVTAPDRTRAFVNTAYMQFLGLPYDQACRFDWRTILHADDYDRVIAESTAGEVSGERFVLEARYRRADGEWRWIRSISQPRFDVAGMPEGFIGVAEDITEAKRAEEAARRHRDELAATVDRRTRERNRLWELSQDPIVICDRDAVWRSVSPAWEAVLGWPTERLLGRTAEWMDHPDDRSAARAAWERLVAGEPLRGFPQRLRAADGSYRWLSWSGVFDGEHAYAIAHDVTAERERSDALREAEEALRQAQKMEALGQLTGGVAHDFNNLLTPILGALDLLSRRDIDRRTAMLVDGALQSATRAKTLVQRLLAFARRQPLQAQPVAIDHLARDLAQLLRSTLGPTITLSIETDPAVPAAIGDANQIEMALLNLAVNARDAMPDGGTLTVRVAAHDLGEGADGLPPGRYVGLSVSDTGIGMADDVRRRAIEPFFSTKGLGAGTGLGLSMVHGLAGQLGGALRIDSMPGEGTTIELLLPSSDVPVAAAAAASRARPVRSLDVLLVDDEALVRSSTAAMLEGLGHRVRACASGAEALALVDAGYVPELLVTDQVMPQLPGDALAAQIGARLPALRTLIVSGFRGTAALGDDIVSLAKPFVSDELNDAIGRLFG